jgi:hypothetical protein
MAEYEPTPETEDPKSSLERQLNLLQHHCMLGQVHYRMWYRLNASFREKPEVGNLAPAFFLFAAEAHLNSVFVIVNRLVDRRRDALSIERFLDAAERVAGTFPGVPAEKVREAIAEDRSTLGNLEQTIEKIYDHRNEQFVHLSRKLLEPPYGVIASDKALMYEDVMKALEIIGEILNRYGAFFGRTLALMEVQGEQEDFDYVFTVVEGSLDRPRK